MRQVQGSMHTACRNEECLQQAAEWFAVLQSGAVTEVDHKRWRDWLTSSTENGLAWEKIEKISGRFHGLPARPARAALNAKGITRRQGLKVLALLLMAGGGVLQVGRQQHWGAQYRTARGEIREVTLADGTKIWLNTATAVDVNYTAELREIRLLEGELYIETAADNLPTKRPLVVNSRQGYMQALGTRFAVREYEEKTRLSVEDGAVRVSLKTADATGQSKRIDAGHQVDFDGANIGDVSRLQPIWWRKGSILANNMRLGDFVAELNRYYSGYLSVDPVAAELRLVGAYPVEDIDRILAALEETLPISVQHTLPWWVRVQAV